MSKIILPDIGCIKNDYIGNKKMLIISEGFEERSMSFVSLRNTCFDKIILCKYSPSKKTRYTELKSIIANHYSRSELYEISYNRFEPFGFEDEFQEVCKNVALYSDVVVDISVMSKYLIMQILYILSHYSGNIKVIYTEPVSHAPLKEEYEKIKLLQMNAAALPSTGIRNIIRTPLLTSTVMQKSPILLVAFLSFNEELIKALLSEFSPMHLYLVNSLSTNNIWRKDALLQIHEKIIKNYAKDNPLDENRDLKRRVSTLDYRQTFELLTSIYHEHCIDKRIILSPTGTKMQTLGCVLIKLCCPDIHIEYPIPESYYIDGYSSSDIRKINQIVFNNMPRLIKQLSADYLLNGEDALATTMDEDPANAL